MPKKTVPRPKFLLLDTHVWIWLMNGSEELNYKPYLQTIEEYSRRDAIRVSAISVWELGVLVAKNRLTLSQNVSLWVKESFQKQGLAMEPLTVDILLESTHMTDDMHRDPADRMIVTTAKNIHAVLMTADAQIIAYCRKHGLAALQVRKK